MKKLRYLIPTILLVPALFACSIKVNDSDSNETKFINATDYEYKAFTVSITTSKNDLSLTSIYKVSKDNDVFTVNYSIEKYNTFDLESGDIPTTAKTTDVGEYTSQDISFSFDTFKFDKNTFDSYNLTSDTLTAKIKNGKNYLNTSFDCVGFEISIKFSEMITEIDMHYSLEDSTYCHIVFNEFK